MTKESDRELLKKYRRRSPLMLIAWIVIFLAVAGIAAVILLPGFMSQGSPAEKAQAKSALRKVVSAAESYRAANDNVFEGITAAKIKNNAGKVTVVDGVPKKANQVGISDYNSKRLVLVYVGKSGIEYVATVENGAIEYDF